MPSEFPTQSSESTRLATTAGGVRVETDILDALMNLVGELVLTRNQVLQFKSQLKDPAFHATTQRLNHITSELQEKLMRTRMQPVSSIWNSIPLMVRDLATAVGKRIRVEMSGSETELERSLLEAIREPLTHLLRNAVEHGIEAPSDRLARGKSQEGRIGLRAYHEAGLVNLEITDDGGGIACERVKAKALKAGLLQPEAVAAITDAEAVNLVFLPGFSATDAGTRSPGMDVVKSHVEKLGGTVDLQSRTGHGTTLRIQIPLTLAIIPALMVECAAEILAIPQSSLLELVRLDAGSIGVTNESEGRIEFIHGAPVFRLRGRLLPLVDLRKELRLEASPDGGKLGVVTENLVILETDGHSFGLMVDRIHDTEEIVVKPLGRLFQSVSAYAGATILGTGRVALILDVHGLAQGAGLFGDGLQVKTSIETRSPSSTDDEGRELLVFEPTPGIRMAIPLAVVSRLEEIQSTAIEYAGAHEVIRYRGSILPLVRVPGRGCSESPTSRDRPSLQVIVCQREGRSAGLIVSSVREVVRDFGSTPRRNNGDGLTESVVLQDAVTDLLDVDAFLRASGTDAPSNRAAFPSQPDPKPVHLHE